MDAEQFIDRLVPPGNFYVVAFKNQGGGISHKYYRDAAGAGNYVTWAASKGMDTWHACASYAQETTEISKFDGKTYQTVRRLQDNVAQIKAFWIDLDISRPGDGKDASKVYSDRRAAMSWVIAFDTATGMPRPNLIVNSGYGMHVYWVLETPIDQPTWQPYAEALKASVLAHGGKADLVVTADSARILRTPGTFNYKVPGSPAAVVAMLATPDFYPNAQIFAALQPFVGLQTAKPTTVVGGGLGPVPAHAQQGSALNTAAQANQPTRDKSFAVIATKCQQIKYSLDTHGEFDDRTIWYLGNLTLAHKTIDGASYVHPLSDGHKGYDVVATDAAMTQIDQEQAKKDTGAPTCKFYQQHRPAQCQGCPFAGKINTPWSLGAKDGDFPKGYRRHNGRIQKEKSIKDMITWDTIVVGDVYAPILSVINDIYHLSFTYEQAGRTMPVSISALDSSLDVGFNIRLFNSQRMTLDTNNAVEFGKFAMAFLNLLKDQRLERDDTVAPYGWSTDDKGAITGLAIAGMHYKQDGTIEAVAGAQREQAAFYKPRGVISTWKKAAAVVSRSRPDVQLMLAATMGAPLMKFTAEPGLVINFYSMASATGKSSAMKVAQNVWATHAAMTTMLDTDNAVCARVAEGQIMPLLWDEIRVDADNARSKTNLMFSIAQGKDKTRMRADTTVRVGREWQTLMICTGNQPLLHLMTAGNAGTDANGMRLMDFEIALDPLPANATVALLVKQADHAAGTAGEVLAKYYAEHHALVARKILDTQQLLISGMQCTGAGERFYIAAMACALVAAGVARKLDLVNFDTSAILQYIKTNWYKIRGDKGGDVSQNGKIDLREVFGRFYSDHSHRHLVTNFFRKQGPVRKGDVFTTVVHPAQLNQPIVMHTTQREKILRIDLTMFKSWLAKKNIPAANVLKEMVLQWGAVDTQRQILGAGTVYAGGQKAALDLRVDHPDLQASYDQGDDPTDPANKPAPAKRSPPLAGNQVV